jgi:hypothetical protein
MENVNGALFAAVISASNKYKGKYCFKRDIMVTDEDASIMLTL